MKNISDTNSPAFCREGVPNLLYSRTNTGSRTSPAALPELFPILLHKTRIPVQCPYLYPLPYCTGSLACMEEPPMTKSCWPSYQQGPTQDDSVERSDQVAEKVAPM